MERDIVHTKDGIKLTYYWHFAGDSYETIVFVNAPGHSIKYWLPLIYNLKTSGQVNLLGMEYRGFPGDGINDLSEEQCSLEHYVGDIELILKKKNVDKIHFVVWCMGAKVAFNYYQDHKNQVKSMTVLNIDYQQGRDSQLIRIIDVFRNYIDKDPSKMFSMIKLINNIGKVPNASFINTISLEEEDSPILDLYDIVSNESSFSGISFYHLNTPVGLNNFLKITDSLRYHDVSEVIRTIAVPTTILYGTKDNFTPLEPHHIELFKCNKNIEYRLIEGGTHYMGMERPNEIASIILKNL